MLPSTKAFRSQNSVRTYFSQIGILVSSTMPQGMIFLKFFNTKTLGLCFQKKRIALLGMPKKGLSILERCSSKMSHSYAIL